MLRRATSRIRGFSLRKGFAKVVGRIPGTPQYRTHYLSLIHKTAHQRMDEFKQLESIDSEAKLDVLNSIRPHMIRVAASDMWLDASVLSTSIISFPILYAVFIGTRIALTALIDPIRLPIALHPIRYFFDLTPDSLILIAALIVLAAPAYALLEVKGNLGSFLFPYKLAGFWLIAVLLGYLMLSLSLTANLDSYPTDSLQRSALVGISLTVTMSLVFVVWAVIFALVRIRYERRVFYWMPDSLVVTRLLRVLVRIERQPNRWADLAFRRNMISDLEDVALCIEVYIPRRVESGNRVLNVAFRQEAEQMAAAVRNLAKWIVAPKPDTQRQFIERVSSNLVSAIRGNWGDFERVEPERIPSVQAWRSRLGALLRVILIGLMPGTVLWVVQSSPALALSDPIAEYAKAGALLWALLSVFVALDPLFGTKLGALKDISSLLPLPGKGKSDTP